MESAWEQMFHSSPLRSSVIGAPRDVAPSAALLQGPPCSLSSDLSV